MSYQAQLLAVFLTSVSLRMANVSSAPRRLPATVWLGRFRGCSDHAQQPKSNQGSRTPSSMLLKEETAEGGLPLLLLWTLGTCE